MYKRTEVLGGIHKKAHNLLDTADKKKAYLNYRKVFQWRRPTEDHRVWEKGRPGIEIDKSGRFIGWQQATWIPSLSFKFKTEYHEREPTESEGRQNASNLRQSGS